MINKKLVRPRIMSDAFSRNMRDETYKDVKMKFYKDDDKIYADAYGHGVQGSGETKKEALEQAKKEIEFKKRKGNL